MIVTRFAPSPTGFLHLGHAFSALFAFYAAKEKGGQFFLRIEDIDPVRCKPEYAAALMDDLHWLGLDWPLPVRRQSEHMADYQNALEKLKALGVIYPCFCTRSQIRAEAEAAGYAPHLTGLGPDGPIYTGTCRSLGNAERQSQRAEKPFVWRLDSAKASKLVGPLFWEDASVGPQAALPELFGDVVLARKDIPTSYHLSVVVDDALQGVTLVTRGKDLFGATHVHRMLQALLGLPTPMYHHHDLVTDEQGQRLAKRANAQTLRSLRAAGLGRSDVLKNFPQFM